MTDQVTLYWTHNGGAMQCDGVSVRLHTLPIISGLPAHITEIQFFHNRGEYRVSADRVSEMDRGQCEAVLAYLSQWAAGARRLLEQ